MTKITASIVMVSLNFLSMCILVTYRCSSGLIYDLLFNISAASELCPDSSGGVEVDSVALGKLIEVMVVIDYRRHNLFSC